MASYHYYFDKDAKMDKDKQKLLSGNTQEFLFGTEYDITDAIQVSVGGQRTKYGLGDGSFLSDMSFVTSSYSIGFGAGIKVTKKATLNVAYFWTNYETFDKEYTQEIGGMPVKCTDSFTRTNKVLGVGVDISL
jgi:predicted porin